MSFDEIMRLEKDAMEQWRTGNPMRWAEISAPEVIYVDPGCTKPVVGLESYTHNLTQIVGKIQYPNSEFIEPKLLQVGDAALLTYNYRSSGLAEDGVTPWQVLWNTTEVYVRLAGQWKIVHTHWSYVNHHAPARVEVPVPVETPAKEYTGVLAELMALEAAAMHRWDHGDPFGFTDISTHDVTYFDSGTPKRINGRDALYAEYQRRVGKISYPVMEFIDPQVLVYGDMAVLFYRFFSTNLKPDGQIAGRTPWNCTEVYVRAGTSWQIAHTHWSLIGGERN